MGSADISGSRCLDEAGVLGPCRNEGDLQIGWADFNPCKPWAGCGAKSAGLGGMATAHLERDFDDPVIVPVNLLHDLAICMQLAQHTLPRDGPTMGVDGPERELKCSTPHFCTCHEIIPVIAFLCEAANHVRGL